MVMAVTGRPQRETRLEVDVATTRPVVTEGKDSYSVTSHSVGGDIPPTFLCKGWRGRARRIPSALHNTHT